MYKHPEYAEMIKRLFSGQEFTFANIPGFETKTLAQTINASAADITNNPTAVVGKALKAKKKKTYD